MKNGIEGCRLAEGNRKEHFPPNQFFDKGSQQKYLRKHFFCVVLIALERVRVWGVRHIRTILEFIVEGLYLIPSPSRVF